MAPERQRVSAGVCGSNRRALEAFSSEKSEQLERIEIEESAEEGSLAIWFGRGGRSRRAPRCSAARERSCGQSSGECVPRLTRSDPAQDFGGAGSFAEGRRYFYSRAKGDRGSGRGDRSQGCGLASLVPEVAREAEGEESGGEVYEGYSSKCCNKECRSVSTSSFGEGEGPADEDEQQRQGKRQGQGR
jgi:hypothetical protein